MISLEQLTKVFTNGKGIFDVSFEVAKGEVFGYLGPNGAGKSTTIRQLLGFMKPSSGSARINGLHVWKDSSQCLMEVGYLPGEISFLEGMTGLDFIKLIEGMRGTKDVSYRNELIEQFQFEVGTPIRKMSKGMKQKVAIVTAFMHNPQVLILDEPTSGLDPLMQKVFIDLILAEREKGKTILMSSHSFQEIERTCDRVGVIKDGRIVAVEDIKTVQQKQRKIFEITVNSREDVGKLHDQQLDILEEKDLTLHIAITGDHQSFVQALSKCHILNLSVRTQELEEMFMHYYAQKEGNGDEALTI
ncbi:ABC transporter ATP-binding protein [Bacillus sp. DJP31]|uniref:ABC transporter ATP-binding protein n=1 Tax=Bacillus sp. DJP31 TaxID=3409789 RepID=UPI003BB6E854